MKNGERVEEFTAGYYGLCGAAGMLSAGATHLAITPLDVLKVNMQVNPVKYKGIMSGFSTLCREEGARGVWKGWSSKLLGYGVQAVKVRVQTDSSFAKGLSSGFPKLYASEGFYGFYKGLLPLWGRNLPFSMIMFTTFEHSVEVMHRKVIKRKREDCSRAQQLTVTCLAGYAAGAVGTVISNPADNIVSSLYNKKAANIMQAVKNIGVRNLFTRSLPIRIAIVGPVVTLQWFLYDSIKLFNGLPTSGGLRRHNILKDAELQKQIKMVEFRVLV